MTAFTAPLPAAARRSPWQGRLLYGAFGGACFVLFLVLSFPYETLKARLVAEAAQQGLYLRIQSLGPGLFAVHASHLEISRKIEDGADAKAPDPLKISSLTLRPSLFPLGLGFSARLLSGALSGAVGGRSEARLKLSWSDLELGDASFQALTGIKATGRLQGDLDIRVPEERTGPSGQLAPDASHAQGAVTFQGDQISIQGGTLTVPIYGTPTPVDLPRVQLGTLTSDVRLENGTGTFQKFAVNGGDLQVNGSGTVRLDRQLPLSELNLEVKLKVEPDFQKRLGILGSGLTMLPQDANQPGWRTARVGGHLGRPEFVGGR